MLAVGEVARIRVPRLTWLGLATLDLGGELSQLLRNLGRLFTRLGHTVSLLAELQPDLKRTGVALAA